MTNGRSSAPEHDGREYDLNERTVAFGEAVIRFAKKAELNAVTSPLVNQLVRAAAGIGANYDEADEAPQERLSLPNQRLQERGS